MEQQRLHSREGRPANNRVPAKQKTQNRRENEKKLKSPPTENEPPGKRLCENLEDIPVSKWSYIRQESGKVKLKNPRNALK